MGFLQEWVGFEESPEYEVKVNTIVNFWSNPCNAPWSVYIETLYPALGFMFLALVDTSLLDIARSYLRPRGGLTRGHNRKKGRRRGRIPRIPDSADLFARMIPGATIYQGMEYGANTRFLWQIDGIVQRGLWYWLVLDATTDGLYYWAQGIKEERYCQPTNRPGFFATTPSVTEVAFFGLWFPSVKWTTSWAEPGFGITIGNLDTPPGRWVFTYHATYHNPGPYTGRVYVRLKNTGPQGQGSVFLDVGQTADLTFSVEFNGGPFYQLETRTAGVSGISGGAGIISVQKA